MLAVPGLIRSAVFGVFSTRSHQQYPEPHADNDSQGSANHPAQQLEFPSYVMNLGLHGDSVSLDCVELFTDIGLSTLGSSLRVWLPGKTLTT